MNTKDVISAIFAKNLTTLMGSNHSVASLARDLDVHRTQIHRFLSGQTFPRPDILQKLCLFFEVDARILTTSLEDLGQKNNAVIPDFILNAFDPVPREILPDGFFEEWRQLSSCEKTHACHILQIKTVGRCRQTKMFLRDVTIDSRGKLHSISGNRLFHGFAIRQAGGIAIIDRPEHNSGLTFTALRSGNFGSEGLFAGHKRSVQSVVGSGHLMKSAVVIRRLENGYPEAQSLRRLPRFRTTAETPEIIQWLLHEQQNTVGFG